MIWPEVISTGMISLMGAGLAVPAARKLMLGDLQQDWLQDELELDCIDQIDDVIIRNKDGSVSRVWHIEGTSYDARIDVEQNTMMHCRSDLVRELGKHDGAIRFIGVTPPRHTSNQAT